MAGGIQIRFNNKYLPNNPLRLFPATFPHNWGRGAFILQLFWLRRFPCDSRPWA